MRIRPAVASLVVAVIVPSFLVPCASVARGAPPDADGALPAPRRPFLAPPGGFVGGFAEDDDEDPPAPGEAPAAPPCGAALAGRSPVDLLGLGTLAAVALAVVVLAARGRRR